MKKAEFSASLQEFIFVFYLCMIFSCLFPVANILGKNSYDCTNLWNLQSSTDVGSMLRVSVFRYLLCSH